MSPSLIGVSGGEVYCRVLGQGRPLLVPGFASTNLYQQLEANLRDDYTLIRTDLRDAGGKTIFPPRPNTFDEQADDVAAVLDALGHERVHYLGLSHTGVLGQAFALRHPNRLDRLALTMTTPRPAGLAFDPSSDVLGDRQLAVATDLADELANAQLGDTAAIRMAAELSYAPSGRARIRIRST